MMTGLWRSCLGEIWWDVYSKHNNIFVVQYIIGRTKINQNECVVSIVCNITFIRREGRGEEEHIYSVVFECMALDRISFDVVQ